MRLIFWFFALLVLTGCKNPLDEENARLKADLSKQGAELASVKKSRDALQQEVTRLKQTADFIYGQAVDAQKKNDRSGSNRLFQQIIERYPTSALRSAAEKQIAKNKEDGVTEEYRSAREAFVANSYEIAEIRLDEFLSQHPDHRLAPEARSLKRRTVQAKKKEREESGRQMRLSRQREERAGSKLELVTWSWHVDGDYAIVEGEVKNISDESLKNVTTQASYSDKNHNFITSSDTLIEYNPILPGQTSPFRVMTTYNPEMQGARVEFKELMGGTIPTYRKD